MTIGKENSDYNAEEEPDVVLIDEAVAVAIPEVQPENEHTPLSAAPASSSATAVPPRSRGFDVLLCGDTKVRGRSIRPGRNFFISLCGNTDIDMRNTPITAGAHYQFTIVRLCGDIKIFVPRGTPVTLRRVMLCGNKDVDIDEDFEDAFMAPVTVTAITLCGDLRIKNDDHNE